MRLQVVTVTDRLASHRVRIVPPKTPAAESTGKRLCLFVPQDELFLFLTLSMKIDICLPPSLAV